MVCHIARLLACSVVFLYACALTSCQGDDPLPMADEPTWKLPDVPQPWATRMQQAEPILQQYLRHMQQTDSLPQLASDFYTYMLDAPEAALHPLYDSIDNLLRHRIPTQCDATARRAFRHDVEQAHQQAQTGTESAFLHHVANCYVALADTPSLIHTDAYHLLLITLRQLWFHPWAFGRGQQGHTVILTQGDTIIYEF